MKILNKQTKTITYLEIHLYPTYVRRLKQGICKVSEISLDNINGSIKDIYKDKMKNEGYKVVFYYQGKNYLLVYNK